MTTTTRRDRVVETLEALQNQHGQLAPEVVVEAAQDQDSPLHNYFEWSDEIAGHAFRIEQARQLIRSVRVELTVHSRTVNVVQYVHDSRALPKESGYVAIEQVTPAGLATQTLEAEFQRIQGVVERAIGIAQGLDLEKDFRQRLRTLLR